MIYTYVLRRCFASLLRHYFRAIIDDAALFFDDAATPALLMLIERAATCLP